MKCKYLTLLASMGFAAFLLGSSPALAKVSLGSTGDFAVLAGTAVTCTDSAVTGDVGVVVGPVTQTNCTIAGTVHVADAAAQQAYQAFLAEYDRIAAMECDEVLTTLGGQPPLSPGVYCFTAAATSTGGVLTLDGPSNGIWIFKIGTGGTGALTGTDFSVVMTGRGEPCNVYWWVAQGATMTDSNFVGTILAGADITITRGDFDGNALAGGAGTTEVPTGEVTLTGTNVAGCEGGNGHGNPGQHCNQGVGNGPETCDPGNSNQGDPSRSNDELGGTPGNPGRKGGNGK